MAEFVDLNDAFGKAILQQFFEPILIGRGSNGEPLYSQSGVSIMAQEIYKREGSKIMDEVWNKIDIEELASSIAKLVVAELQKTPGIYQRNIPQEKLKDRILEIVAQDLGQRVVDNIGVRLEPKELD